MVTISQIEAGVVKFLDGEGRYVQKAQPEKEAAIREAFVRFGLLKE